MNNEDIEILEDKKKGSKRPYVIAIALALLLVVTITATSYAYFVANVTNDGTVNNTIVTTTSLEIEYTDGAQVGLENAIPGTYVTKTFKIENKGSGDTTYDVYLSDLVNNFVDKTDLVYTLTSVDGGANVSSQTQVPATSSKIVNSQLLRAGETHNYTLRIDFLETNDNQDDNKARIFSTIIRVNESQDAPAAYTIVSGDLDTVGSVVRIANEEFYVVGQQDSTHVKLLAKYNLNVGSNQYKENGVVVDNGLQNSNIIGRDAFGDGSFYGAVPYSSTAYWSSDTLSIGTVVYDSRNDGVKNYVDSYVNKFTVQGVNATGRLLTWADLESLGCEYYQYGGGYSCTTIGNSGNFDWLFRGCSWTGSGTSSNAVLAIYFAGGTGNFTYNDSDSCGVRPVIILEK